MALSLLKSVHTKKDKWLQNFARFGFTVKGIVYCLMGTLTVMAALGLSNEKGDKEKAFKVIYDQPFGKIILIAVAIGLLGYVTFRLFQTFADSSHKGNGPKGLIIRIGYGISAFLYLALSFYAISLSTGNSESGGGDTRQFFINRIMEYQFGEWFVGIASLIIIGSGLNQIHKGVATRFMKSVRLTHSQYTQAFKKAGVVGYVSRGVVLCIIGYLFLQAAIQSNPSEAQGTEGAFDLLQNTFGNILMGLVALGLVGYGVFMFVRARYERIHLSTDQF